MAGIFDSIPIITIVLFALGLVGVVVYEKIRSDSSDEPNSNSSFKNLFSKLTEKKH